MKLKINMLFASLLFSGVVNAAIVNHGDNNTSDNDSVVIGNNNKGKWQSVAIGNENQAGDQAIALGSFSEADDRAIAIGRTAKATVNEAISIGNDSSANDWGSISLGDRAVSTHSKLTEDEYKKATNPNGPISNFPGSAIAIGQQTTAAGEHSVAIGGGYAATNADNATALGAGAQVTIDNSVALGALSKVGNNEIREGKSYSSGENVSGKAGVVSVGSKNNERVITNVKGGIEDTDAVNVLQLKSVEKNANSYTDNKVNNIDNKVNNIDNKVNNIDNKVNNIDNKVNNIDNKVNNIDNKVNNIDNKVNELYKKVDRGLASSAALNGLFQPYNVGNFNVTAGIGGYRSETAIAIGSGYRFNENLAAKAGISTSTSNTSSVMYNTSVNFEW
jgi:adhesin YadA